MIDREYRLLTAHGHDVERYFFETASIVESRFASAAAAFWNRPASAEVRSMVADFQPHVAHVHTPFPVLSPSILRTLDRCGVPTVETLHLHRMVCVAGTLQRDGSPCTECVGKKVTWPAVRHRCYHGSVIGSAVMSGSLAVHHLIGTFEHSVDRYIALSEFCRDQLLASGFPAGRVVVKPNFVEGPGTPGDGTGGHVVFVGRLVEEKGARTLIDAWSLLDDAPELLIVGDGPLRAELEAQAEGMPVRFTGRLSQQDVARVVGDAALTVFPSENLEAGPLVIIESFAVGTPVLVSDIGNFTEQVQPGVNGEHFRVGDPADLARHVDALLSDRARLAEMRRAAHRTYETSYTPEVSYDALMSIYAAAQDERGRRASG